MTDKADWLARLQVGDLVVVRSAHFLDRYDGQLATVARFTPMQIVTQTGARFRRKDGQRTGVAHCASVWIEKPTAEMERTNKAQQTLRQVESIQWKDVPTATLEAVLALVPKASKRGE